MNENKISIVIPTFGRSLILKELIYSVRHSTPENAYEFIIVSSDLPESDKVKWLKEQKDVQLILTGQRKKWQLRKESLYYYTNLGIKKSQNEWVFVVNDDMIFDEEWYREFKNIVNNSENINIGMIIVATHIGAVSLGVRVAKIGKTKKDKEWKDLYLSDLSIIKKQVLVEIGYFDENLEWYGSGADNSLSVEFLTNKDTLVTEKIKVNHLIAEEHRNASTEDAFKDFHYITNKWNNWCKENNKQYCCDFNVDAYTIKNRLKHYIMRKFRIIRYFIKVAIS